VSSRNGWCRHRTAFDKEKHPTCKAGVDYHQFRGNFRLMPCLGESAEAIARCPQFAPWTPEENAAREKAWRERFDRIGIIREAIIAAVGSTGERAGRMPCPACKTGTVSYSQASNGHTHACCSTSGCAAWME
jgi:hypothetical protein